MPQPFLYSRPGIDMAGELYRPTGAPNGHAILVFHEADGIGGNVRRRCAMLADLGYVAAAADLHGDGRVLEDEEIPVALERYRSDPALIRDRTHAALEALVESTGFDAGHIAAIGYCFGGYAVLELARSGARLSAVASFHGLLKTELPAPAGGVMPRILCCTGARDPLVPPSDLAQFQAEMTEAAADWQLIVYGRALHSFTNPGVAALNDRRMGYDAPADRQSWAALLGFLEESLTPIEKAGTRPIGEPFTVHNNAR